MSPADQPGPVGAAVATETCPGCGQTDGVQLTSATPRAIAWTCTCGLSWATSVVNPHLYPAQLAAAVDEISRQRQILRQVIALAEEQDALSDAQLRARLVALADSATR